MLETSRRRSNPAAFINSIADEGSKAEAIKYLQETWDELQNLRAALIGRGFLEDQINRWQREGR